MSTPKPLVVWGKADTVGIYTNEMDLVLEIVEQVARLVPLNVLDELGTASRRLEELKAWDASDYEITDAARAVDNARDLVPGINLDLVSLTPNEATDLAHEILRTLYFVEAVAL